ncbi:MAG: Gfo/Idh/MocA family oxidoreductase [Gemmatimonadota bacterium]|nr:Gfo/Idh/MocA family oxidoreductase [Gemmatimonadota bacterium]
MDNITRRALVKTSAGLAAGLATASIFPSSLSAAVHTLRRGRVASRIRFGVIGMNHGHIYGQVDTTTKGGGELVSFYAKEPELRAAFARRYPNAKVAKDEREVLDDPTIQLILSASIPAERAPLGIRVMKAGKDFMSDKPGITSLEQLAEARKVQAQTKRIYSILYSEHFEVGAAVKAGDLVKAGAIGQVIQTIGLGPHRVTPASRPAWFWDTANYGGIITDLASHQFEQFLFFTNSSTAEIVASQVRNIRHKDKPHFEDFGDVMIRGNGGTGYIRVDWFTPDGLPTWGDGRMTILGTDGYIELRKYVDIGGATPGGDHLFLVDNKSVQKIDCKGVEKPYGRLLVDDVINRTETAMPQDRCFLAAEMSIKAQLAAKHLSI